MRNLFGISSLLFASTLMAQAPVANTAIVVVQPGSRNCPVSLAARRGSSSGILQTQQTAAAHQQSLQLTFTPQATHSLVNAQLTLHGFSGNHVVPAGGDTRADTTERLAVAAYPGEQHRSGATIYPATLSSVQWIELNEINFSDGTQWQATATSICRFAPVGSLLVTLNK